MFLHNFYQYVQIYMTRYDVVVTVAELSCCEEGRTPDCGSGRLMRLFEAKLLSVGGGGGGTSCLPVEPTLGRRKPL